MNHPAESRRMLDAIDSISLRFAPKTDEPVEMLLALCAHLKQLSRAETIELRKRLSGKLGFKLMYLSVLAAEKSLNCPPAEWLDAAVGAHVVEGMRVDYRENYLRLAEVYSAARRAGACVSGLLDRYDGQLDDTEREMLWYGLDYGDGRRIEVRDAVHRFVGADR